MLLNPDFSIIHAPNPTFFQQSMLPILHFSTIQAHNLTFFIFQQSMLLTLRFLTINARNPTFHHRLLVLVALITEMLLALIDQLTEV